MNFLSSNAEAATPSKTLMGDNFVSARRENAGALLDYTIVVEKGNSANRFAKFFFTEAATGHRANFELNDDALMQAINNPSVGEFDKMMLSTAVARLRSATPA